MTITWGDVKFDGPYPATSWNPPKKAAVYAIMRKPDPKNKPETYRIMYFGESGNLSDRGFWRSHHKYKCFVDKAGSEANIYIGVHAMPNSTAEQRRAVEKRLNDQCELECMD